MSSSYKLALPIHHDTCLSISGQRYLKSLLCIELLNKSEWLKTTILQNNWSQRTYPAWTQVIRQFIERQFMEQQFIERQFIETTVHRTTIHRTTIYRNDSSSNWQFIEPTVHRTDSSSNRQFIEPTVHRTDRLSNDDLSNDSLSKRLIWFNCCKALLRRGHHAVMYSCSQNCLLNFAQVQSPFLSFFIIDWYS